MKSLLFIALATVSIQASAQTNCEGIRQEAQIMGPVTSVQNHIFQLGQPLEFFASAQTGISKIDAACSLKESDLTQSSIYDESETLKVGDTASGVVKVVNGSLVLEK